MIIPILSILSRYALGIIPLPNRYVTWLEHSNAATMMIRWKGTIENTTVYHRSRTLCSYLIYGALHPGKILLE